MKYLDAAPGVLVLVLRLALVAPGRWALDWISVLALIWIALTVTAPESRPRRWSLAVGCVWLAVIYGIHQAPWTLAGFR
jgi:hypothetical protein